MASEKVGHFDSTNLNVFVGLRPGIHSWLKFQPEDEGDGKVILPRR